MADKPVEAARLRTLTGTWRTVTIALSTLGLALTVNQVFNLRMFSNIVLLENRYLYLMVAIFLSMVFLWYPARPASPRDRVPLTDMALFAVTLGIGLWFAWTGERSVAEAWEFAAPPPAVVMAFILWAIILEGARRTGGWAFFVPMFIFSLYPLYAETMPGPLAGKAFSLVGTASYHIMSNESVLGIPMQVFGSLIVGFIVFGTALQLSGGGQFFLNLSFALLGHVRGGPAKVAVLSSGLFGSLSGSVISNVISTGSMTIPAMKRTGYPAAYAGGVEACASTGGVLMPPVMGTTAFVMASFLGVPYISVAVAAALPAALYYYGLFVQIDAYAARAGMTGMPRNELPRIGETLKQGWIYLFSFGLLIWLLLYLKREAHAPYYATIALLVTAQLRKSTRIGVKDLINFLDTNGRILAELIGILAAVGLIIGGLVVTGMAGSLAGELVRLAGGNILALLIMGAFTSFVLGFGMTVTACYIFLAVILAPALVKMGLNPMAVHLFLLYWGMLSFITPPVALGAYAASSIAQAHPMRTGFEAMRLGSIIYFLPFFFVLNPALIFDGPWEVVLRVLATSGLGVTLIAAGLQGYLIGVGTVATGRMGWIGRSLLVLGGFGLADPNWHSDIVGLLIALPGAGIAWSLNRNKPATAAS